jgi:hypothetical protein
MSGAIPLQTFRSFGVQQGPQQLNMLALTSS